MADLVIIGKIKNSMSPFFLLKAFVMHQYAHLMYMMAKVVTMSKPLNARKYFCMSMSGNSYGDNIKCLSDYISEHQPDAQIVWAFKSGFIRKVDCPHTVVSLYSFKYYYHILTSRYILSNARLNQRMLHKQKGQKYIQTWHGTALKRLGYDIKKDRSFLQRMLRPDVFEFDVKNTDVMVSGSRFMTNVFRNSFRFEGKIIETGTPRNDIFFGDYPEIRQRVCNTYGIDPNAQVVLYAPTFRSNGTFNYYDLDSETLMREWSNRTGKDCVLMIRLHPNLMHRNQEMSALFPNAINVSKYPDMQELLYIADLLVTDYSSTMFDYMYSRKPVLLYTPDSEEYDRGFYFELSSLPFLIAYDNDSLPNVISSYDPVSYKSDVEKFLKRIESFEDGRASKKVVEFLHTTINEN